MSKSSPGPWKWDGDVLMNQSGGDDFFDNCVMHCPGAEWPPSDDDKRLIAASPRMLELLREIEAEPNDTAWKADIRALLAEIDGD